MTKLKCEELLDAFLNELRIKRKSNKLYYMTNPMPSNGEFWQRKARAAEKIAERQKFHKEIADYYGRFEDAFLEDFVKSGKAHPQKTFVQDSTVSFRPFKPLLEHEIDFLRYEAMSNEANNRAMYRNCVMGDWDMKEYTVNIEQKEDAPIMPAEAWKYLVSANEKCKQLEKELEQSRKFVEALENIVWYNGHLEFLTELMWTLRDAELKGESLVCPIPIEKWGTEEHFFWMILVGMFGDFGTSCRSGWIENNKAADCMCFIAKICELSNQNEKVESADEKNKEVSSEASAVDETV